jgi:hypothetical protein
VQIRYVVILISANEFHAEIISTTYLKDSNFMLIKQFLTQPFGNLFCSLRSDQKFGAIMKSKEHLHYVRIKCIWGRKINDILGGHFKNGAEKNSRNNIIQYRYEKGFFLI